jgi:hypothetical protein
MAKKGVNSVTSNPMVEFHRLFGPALVFKTEDQAIYKAILEGLAEDEKPRTMIERILIRDMADLVYQRLWLRSLGPRLIACAHTRNMCGSASLISERAEDRKRRLRENHASSFKLQSNANVSAAAGTESESEKELKAEIEKIDAETQETLMQIKEAENGPVHDAPIFTRWIGDYERVQDLLAAADKKFSDTLRLLDEYRHGLAQRVHQVASDIIDVDFEESSPAVRAHQRVLAGSSIAAVEEVTPATKAMLRPAVPHPAGVRRRRRSASPSFGRAQSKAMSSGEAQPGKVAALDQKKSDQ